jgi:hypothetical protein
MRPVTTYRILLPIKPSGQPPSAESPPVHWVVYGCVQKTLQHTGVRLVVSIIPAMSVHCDGFSQVDTLDVLNSKQAPSAVGMDPAVRYLVDLLCHHYALSWLDVYRVDALYTACKPPAASAITPDPDLLDLC